MNYDTRFKKLNNAQQEAVLTTEGPLMVIAGPGTGKTELLSMRAANILRTTDTLPENILCLTFTESGAHAMRERLVDIIGQDAYKIAVHTFHSFGAEIINHNAEYFYNGAQFQPASDVAIYELLRSLFDTLPHSNPLSSTMNGEYTHLADTLQVISELKRSSLTSDELRIILDDNERVIDTFEAQLATLFSDRISNKTIDALAPIVMEIANLPEIPLPGQLSSLIPVLAISLSRAIDEANGEKRSTKPITAWRNTWMEKNASGSFIFKDRKRSVKLRAVANLYANYIEKMQEASLYDFDDMILNVVHALELNQELRLNLQEKYLYVMVDEFQDTNLAQNRLLTSLADNPINEGAPNLMVVGDDDQAIYSFQGAELSNILNFRGRYETATLITLTENYRSTSAVLDAARSVITQGKDRLETFLPELDKTLHANIQKSETHVSINQLPSLDRERQWIIEQVKQQLDAGVSAEEITVLARRHHELISLLPYFNDANIAVNYERRQNVLESEIIIQLEILARFIRLSAAGRHTEANALLPEILAHPAWKIEPATFWKLSLQASKNKSLWLEELALITELSALHAWLVDLVQRSYTTPLEPMIDLLFGTTPTDEYQSPLYTYFFPEDTLTSAPDEYIAHLGALRTLRDKLREHSSVRELKLTDLIEYIDLQRSLGTVIVDVTRQSQESSGKVNLMTAHKAKGLEFDHVYIFGAADSSWGEKVRSRSRLVTYPENLPLAPAGDSYDERLRLFYVAMTRARHGLHISFSEQNDSASPLLPARFLSSDDLPTATAAMTSTNTPSVADAKREWYSEITTRNDSLRSVLEPLLQSYKLSATHLNTFLDVTRGGPEHFLVQNLLRFPQAMSANAAYGSAVHKTLNIAHSHLSASGTKKPVEDLLQDFEASLKDFGLLEKEYTLFHSRGTDYLQQFFTAKYDSFSPSQRSELNFSSQQSMVGDARLTGALDLVDIQEAEKVISVTDYKTGKPSHSWRGKTDAEKIKLHKYRQQLMFYKLLIDHSRQFHSYTVETANLQYVEPSQDGEILSLSIDFDESELAEFTQLIQAVWRCITTLEFPDISDFSQDYKGILEFEASLRAKFDR